MEVSLILVKNHSRKFRNFKFLNCDLFKVFKQFPYYPSKKTRLQMVSVQKRCFRKKSKHVIYTNTSNYFATFSTSLTLFYFSSLLLTLFERMNALLFSTHRTGTIIPVSISVHWGSLFFYSAFFLFLIMIISWTLLFTHFPAHHFST